MVSYLLKLDGDWVVDIWLSGTINTVSSWKNARKFSLDLLRILLDYATLLNAEVYVYDGEYLSKYEAA